MTKLKIDLLNGALEVEGEESFVSKIYEDYKQKMDGKHFPLSQKPKTETPQKSVIPTSGGKDVVKGKKAVKKTGKKGETYKFIDFEGGAATIQELKAFYEERSPRNGFERNTVFVYFLEKKKGASEIGVDHIYSCHKNVGVPVPGALKQNLYDTAHVKNWINTNDVNNIKITTLGENLVEHTLPVKPKK